MISRMRRSCAGEQQAHRDGGDALALELQDRALDGRFVQRHQNRAVRRDALAHLLAQVSGRQETCRLGLQHEIVHGAPHLPADLEHVPEALGGDQPDLGALGLEHRIGRDRGAVHEAGDRLRRDGPVAAHEVERRANAGAGVLTRGRNLDEAHAAVAAAAHHIREGAADVDPDLDRMPRRHQAAP
jgi:hypothetical protein